MGQVFPRSTPDMLAARAYANPSFARWAKHWARSRGSADKGKKKRPSDDGRFSLAAELGFEPRHTESESAVLPLHNSARCMLAVWRLYIVAQEKAFVKGFLKNIWEIGEALKMAGNSILIGY